MPCAFAARTSLVQLRAGGNGIIDHKHVQTLFGLLANGFFVHGADNHAAGFDAHHLARRQIGDGDKRTAHQILRLVIRMDSGKNRAVFARAVIQGELQKLLALGHRDALFHLHGTEIGLAERVEIDKLLEQGLDGNLGVINSRNLVGRIYARGGVVLDGLLACGHGCWRNSSAA